MMRGVTDDRGDVLARVWDCVPVGRPVVVAVDGPDGAGKTTFADDLARVAPAGRSVVRATLDDFHHPRAYRHAEGRTGETVWSRSYDYAAVRRVLLDPWLRGADATYRTRWHDLATDALVVDAPSEVVPREGVLVVDGVFAQRPELADAWDLVVYVDARAAVRVARMAARDGAPADPDHPDQRRYLDAQRIYRERCDPVPSADVVLDLDDPDRIRVRRTSPRAAPVAQNDRP
jgi:uridine kinase